MKPQVSIIIPTYNRSHFLKETLDSVKSQSFTNWECLIIDDGSTDATKELVETYNQNDSRFKYFLRPETQKKGPSACRNFGLEKSTGQYIQWLDDDDLLSKDKIEIQIQALNNNEKIFITCDWTYLWEGKELMHQNSFNGKRLIQKNEYFDLLFKNKTFAPLHSFLIPTTICCEAGAWNTDLSLNDDGEYLTRILIHSEFLLNAETCYVIYRNHSEFRLSRMINENSLRSLLESLNLMSNNLRAAGIISKNFFRWKLFLIFHNPKFVNYELLNNYAFLFREFGINLKYSWYYKAKHYLYSKIYPFYKEMKTFKI